MPRESEKDLLKRVPGIGEKKAQGLVDEFGDNPRGALGGLTTASTSSFDDVDGFSREGGRQLQRDLRSYDIDKGIYDDDPRERDAKTKGEFSDAVTSNLPGTDQSPDDTLGFEQVQETDFTRTETKRAEKFHESRTEQAQAVDEAQRAPIADSFGDWRSDKSGLDFPGVDTPDFDGF